jgi:hypothetical protein
LNSFAATLPVSHAQEVLQNVKKDRPHEAAVRLWTSALPMSNGAAFYSIWCEALREDDPTVMPVLAALCRLLNRFCCKARPRAADAGQSAAAAAVPAPMIAAPALVPWPADHKLHRNKPSFS